MMRLSLALRAGLTALVTVSVAAPAAAALHYSVEALPFDGYYGALNNLGQTVGFISDGPQGAGAYLRDGAGQLQFLGSASDLAIFSVNGRGDVAWASPNGDLEADPAYFYDHTKKSATEVSASPFYPGGVNDAGQVAGVAGPRFGFVPPAAAIWQAGTGVQTLPGMGELGSSVSVSNINNKGQLFASWLNGVSYLYTPGQALQAMQDGQRGVRINDEGDYVVLDTWRGEYQLVRGGTKADIIDSASGWVYGLNNQGVVLGDAFAGEPAGGFILDGTGMHSLSSLIPSDAHLTWRYGLAINDRGQILMHGSDTAGNEHNYLYTPVPEPSEIVLTLAGILVTVARRQHHQPKELEPC